MGDTTRHGNLLQLHTKQRRKQMKHPLHDAMEKIGKSVANGHITLDELIKASKKYPDGIANAYLKTLKEKP